ncbi:MULTISPECIES: HAD family hydrolase [Paenibacillus]|uniref:HAD family hydrolase n=1 Tax=Paenibacillus TaxID=44249 RepID=UPI0022B8F83C|nr:HAD family hydrolase [Paenibacillus caseinilyticus]MCZ8520660.1 HAD family hydrolase [Paenibacillus caseinilyticus]
MWKSGVRGVIFDMDNTLLSSRIDFAAMKADVYRLLKAWGALPDGLTAELHTTATLIELAKEQGLEAGRLKHIWEIVSEHELRGMEGADPEPGVEDMLRRLQGTLPLAIVTNNAEPAARAALELTGLSRYIDLLVGREGMRALKPSSSGYETVLANYPDIPPAAWVSLGDSWIDGKGSSDAGIPFVSYRSAEGIMEARGIRVVGRIMHMDEWILWLQTARGPAEG